MDKTFRALPAPAEKDKKEDLSGKQPKRAGGAQPHSNRYCRYGSSDGRASRPDSNFNDDGRNATLVRTKWRGMLTGRDGTGRGGAGRSGPVRCLLTTTYYT